MEGGARVHTTVSGLARGLRLGSAVHAMLHAMLHATLYADHAAPEGQGSPLPCDGVALRCGCSGELSSSELSE